MAESPIISSMVLEPPDKEDKKNSWTFRVTVPRSSISMQVHSCNCIVYRVEWLRAQLSALWCSSRQTKRIRRTRGTSSLGKDFPGYTQSQRCASTSSWVWQFGYDIEKSDDDTKRRWVCKVWVDSRRPNPHLAASSGTQSAEIHLWNDHKSQLATDLL
ncbi:hypothetical protein FOCG_17412 [Fusarium oxysporum f. sp. radicis-lycopersici 26381]|nr:hypothetical protein FOCG_17412 [Fusarium oxysporum f. sp. radicis-lycopersici 26381]